MKDGVYMNDKVFETERLIIRHFKESDAEDFFEYASTHEVGDRAGFPPHPSVEFSLEFIKNIFMPNPDVYALELKSENKVIGAIELRNAHKKDSFENLNLPANTHEIGASLNPKYWSQGYMSEAANRMIQFAFEELNSEGVYATTSSKNIGSQKLQEKCGMKYIDSIPRERKWIDGSDNETQRRGITREDYLDK